MRKLESKLFQKQRIGSFNGAFGTGAGAGVPNSESSGDTICTGSGTDCGDDETDAFMDRVDTSTEFDTCVHVIGNGLGGAVNGVAGLANSDSTGDNICTGPGTDCGDDQTDAFMDRIDTSTEFDSCSHFSGNYGGLKK